MSTELLTAPSKTYRYVILKFLENNALESYFLNTIVLSSDKRMSDNRKFDKYANVNNG